MNDSFSRLAGKIRQNKINKKEIENIKREIIDNKVLKIIKNDMAIRIQKIIRGFLYRKKFNIFLDEVNTETIINYLYEKKLERINTNYKTIISNHLSNYIKRIREEKEKINKHKIYCINLIKAYLRGIIFRKNFNREISSLKGIRNIIERYILGYKIKLILRSNNIQSLLIDIANIKYSLNNIDKNNEANNQKIKELKTKLTKNINLFYFTFYQMKENSNWISQTKIQEPWIKKYLSIINKDENDKNIFIKKKSIYSNQKKIRRLKENNNNNKNNDNKKEALKSSEYIANSKNNTISHEKDINMNNEKEILNTENDFHNDKKNKENKDNNLDKNDKNYDFNFYDSESDEAEENINRKILHKGTETYKNKNIKNEIKKNKTLKEEIDIDLKQELKTTDENDKEKEKEKQKGKKMRNNIVKRYKSKKTETEQKLESNPSKSSEEKEEEKNIDKTDNKEISDFNEKVENQIKKNKNEENNEYNNDEINDNDKENKNLENEKEKELEIKPKKLNKYQQREERPIKPLTNINFLENENPFGLKRESSENISESQDLNSNLVNKKNTIEKRIINSTRAINRAIITYNQKGKDKKQNISEIEKEETIKTQEKTDLSHEELPVSNKYIEYDNRPCGGGAKNNALYDINKYEESLTQKKLDRNERPLGGMKQIDYNAMFGEGGEDFEGDPFGGAKQYESNNNNKAKNIHKSNTIKKKPVYDARKAIEEAKIKEAKEGKKEKPSAFREFLREMKKISAEEKASHNETATNNDNIKNEKKIKNNNKTKNELNTESNIKENKFDKTENQEKANKKNTKRQDKGLNLIKENEDNNEFSSSDKNNLNINVEDKENTLRKKRGSVAMKGSETKEIALRKKLHELERAPAPVLNIKGIKSRIECWGGSNDNKRSKVNTLAPKPKEKTKSRDEKKTKNNKNNDQKLISNFINNKKLKDITDANNNKINKNASSNNIPKISKNMEEKIEKYVDKKLMQLNLQIEEIDELFNFDNYFKTKEDKMKLYINLPYIKENYDFVTKYVNEDYDEKIEKIEKTYKELK